MAKGVNDYKKGNRTNSKRNTTAMVEGVKQYSKDIQAYKDIAEKMRGGRKFKQEEAIHIYNRIIEYMETQDANEKPYTVSGVIKASGLSKDTYYRMLGGEYDWKLYEALDKYNIETNSIYKDSLPIASVLADNGEEIEVLLLPYSEIMQKVVLTIEEQAETRLYEKSRVGDIFTLKSLHGWRDDSATSPSTVNNTLVISTEDAREAIRLLEKR